MGYFLRIYTHLLPYANLKLTNKPLFFFYSLPSSTYLFFDLCFFFVFLSFFLSFSLDLYLFCGMPTFLCPPPPPPKSVPMSLCLSLSLSLSLSLPLLLLLLYRAVC